MHELREVDPKQQRVAVSIAACAMVVIVAVGLFAAASRSSTDAASATFEREASDQAMGSSGSDGHADEAAPAELADDDGRAEVGGSVDGLSGQSGPEPSEEQAPASVPNGVESSSDLIGAETDEGETGEHPEAEAGQGASETQPVVVDTTWVRRARVPVLCNLEAGRLRRGAVPGGYTDQAGAMYSGGLADEHVVTGRLEGVGEGATVAAIGCMSHRATWNELIVWDAERRPFVVIQASELLAGLDASSGGYVESVRVRDGAIEVALERVNQRGDSTSVGFEPTASATAVVRLAPGGQFTVESAQLFNEVPTAKAAVKAANNGERRKLRSIVDRGADVLLELVERDGPMKFELCRGRDELGLFWADITVDAQRICFASTATTRAADSFHFIVLRMQRDDSGAWRVDTAEEFIKM